MKQNKRQEKPSITNVVARELKLKQDHANLDEIGTEVNVRVRPVKKARARSGAKMDRFVQVVGWCLF